jgi:hypothetical protein
LVIETTSTRVGATGLAPAFGKTKAKTTPINIANPISINTMVNVLFEEVDSAMFVSEWDRYTSKGISRLYTLV